MGDIFISYASEDREWVKNVAESLEATGCTVWWDRAIRAGQDYQRVIENALNEASCVIVVWSVHSVDSQWVRAEANVARERGLLVPISMDQAEPSLIFRHLQTADLSQWTGDPAAPEFTTLVSDIAGRLNTQSTPLPHPPHPHPLPPKEPQKSGGETPPPPSPWLKVAWAAALLLVVWSGYFVYNGIQDKTATDTAKPILIVDVPKPGELVSIGPFAATGFVTDQSVCQVWVNDRPADVIGQRWSAEVQITPATAQITVTATDAAGNHANPVAIAIQHAPTAEPPPIELALESPVTEDVVEEGDLLVRGTLSTGENWIVEVNGTPATVDGNSWSSTIPVSAETTEIRVTGRNASGEATSIVRAVAVQPKSLIALLPAKTRGVIHLADPSDLWSKIQASPIGHLIAPDWHNLLKNSPVDLAHLLESLQGECIVAVGDLSPLFHQPFAPAILPVIIMGDAGAGISAIESELTGWSTSARDWNVGSRLYTLDASRTYINCYFAIQGTRYFISPNQEFMQQVLTGQTDGGDASLVEVAQRHRLAGSDAFMYLYLEQAFRIITWLAPDASFAEDLSRWQAADRLVRGDSFRSVELGLGITAQGVECRVVLPTVGPPDGLLSALVAQPFAVDQIKDVPADAPIFASLALNLSHGARALLKLIDVLNGESGQAKRTLQRDWKEPVESLIASLGEAVHLTLNPEQRRDAALVTALSSTLAFQTELNRLPLDQATADAAGQLGSASVHVDGRSRYCIHQNRLIFAEGSDIVAKILRQQQLGAGRPIPLAARTGLPEKVNGLFVWRTHSLQSTIRNSTRSYSPNAVPSASSLRWSQFATRCRLLSAHAVWRDGVGYSLESKLHFR